MKLWLIGIAILVVVLGAAYVVFEGGSSSTPAASGPGNSELGGFKIP